MQYNITVQCLTCAKKTHEYSQLKCLIFYTRKDKQERQLQQTDSASTSAVNFEVHFW